MLKLLSSSWIPCGRLPDGAANGALEKSPLFRVIRSLRSSTGGKTLFRLTAAEEADYASAGADAEEDHLKYIGEFTCGRLADFGAALSMANKLLCQQVLEELDDFKLLSALANNCKRSVIYAGAFLFKYEPGIDPSLVSGTETGKSIYEFKGQELFNRLHNIGTLAQISSIQQNEVYLLGHHRLRKMEMVGVALLEDKIRESRLRWFGHIKRMLSDDLVRKVEYIGEFICGRLADFGAALSMANKLLCQLVLEELDDSKLLSALADNCKRSVIYAGAFLFKYEPGIDPSLVSGTETGKSIYEFKGQELFNRLHDIGTLAQYIVDFTYGRLADFGAALSMANKLLCQQVLEELDN